MTVESQADRQGVARESARVDTRAVTMLVASFVSFVAVALVGLFFWYRHVAPPGSVAQALTAFPIPQLQASPTRDLAVFRRRQAEQLTATGWVDRGRGRIRIPIADAMALVAARGEAGWDPPDPAPSGGWAGAPPDGAPRATPSLRALPYGAPP